MYLVYHIFFGTLDFLSTRNYWEQILLIFGFIILFFAIRIELNGIAFRKDKKEQIINEQSRTIRILEEEIEQLKNKKD